MLEELKIIMETIGQATGAAKQFGIYWLTIELLKVILAYSLGAAAIFVSSKIIHKLLLIAQEDTFVKGLRQIISPQDAWGPLMPSEKRKIIEIVNRGLKRN